MSEELLSCIWGELSAIRAVLSQQPQNLGFHPAPVAARVYVGQGEGYLWYTWNHAEEKPNPIHHDALTGTIVDLKADNSKQFKGEVNWKLLCDIRADRLYRVESGIKTTFSKGLILAIASLTPQQLQQPITIAVRPGEENNVFCRVYVNNEPIKVDWPENGEDKKFWRAALDSAIANVKAATGEVS